MVNPVCQGQILFCNALAADFTAADAAALGTATLHLLMDILAQAGAFAACHDFKRQGCRG
jgi:hypothetical protein